MNGISVNSVYKSKYISHTYKINIKASHLINYVKCEWYIN